MRPAGGVAVVFLRALLDSGARANVDAAAARAELGITKSALDDLGGWIPLETMTRAWQIVPERSGDPDFGIHAAETTPTGVYGVLEYATITSPSALAALQRVERYYRLLGAMSEVRFTSSAGVSRMSLRPIVSGARELRHYAEHFFTLIATRVAMLTLARARPRWVSFTHAAPSDVRAHARIFGDDVRFGRPRAELVFETAALEGPLVTSNAALAGILAQTESTLERPGANEPTTARLRRELRVSLASGDLRIGPFAKRLGVSTRTLQRKLDDEATSFSDVVDGVRRELALEHVAAARASLGEIAFLLGFSQVSAFHRAFRRWTGATPGEYRVPARRRR